MVGKYLYGSGLEVEDRGDVLSQLNQTALERVTGDIPDFMRNYVAGNVNRAVGPEKTKNLSLAYKNGINCLLKNFCITHFNWSTILLAYKLVNAIESCNAKRVEEVLNEFSAHNLLLKGVSCKSVAEDLIDLLQSSDFEWSVLLDDPEYIKHSALLFSEEIVRITGWQVHTVGRPQLAEFIETQIFFKDWDIYEKVELTVGLLKVVLSKELEDFELRKVDLLDGGEVVLCFNNGEGVTYKRIGHLHGKGSN